MKKTHLYGAVAATMLLAPVTANVLADEGETSPLEATETQNMEEWTEEEVLPLKTEGKETEEIVDEIDLSKEESTLGKKEDNADNISEDSDKGFQTVTTKSDVETLPAEEMYVPAPVTLDEEIEIQDIDSSDLGTVNGLIQSFIGTRITVGDFQSIVYKNDFAIDPSKFDISGLSTVAYDGNHFSTEFTYNIRDISQMVEEETGYKFGESTKNKISIVLNYNHLTKKWVLNTNGMIITDGEKRLFNQYFSSMYIRGMDSIYELYPDLGQVSENNLDDETIVKDFYESLELFNVNLNGTEVEQAQLSKDDFVILKPNEILVLPPSSGTVIPPNLVTIAIDTQAVAKRFNLPNNAYYYSYGEKYEDTKESQYRLENYYKIPMYFTTNGKWKMMNGGDKVIQMNYETVTADVKSYQEKIESLMKETVKVHIYDISDKNHVTELEYDSKNCIPEYDELNIDENGVIRTGVHGINIDLNKYLKSYEELKNGKYKFVFSQPESEELRITYPTLISSNYDGFGYHPELVIYVEKDPLSENQYHHNSIQLSAKTNEDLYGLEFKAEQSTSNNNFGFDADTETVAYTFSFVNRQGEVIQRTGTFEIQIPIPTEWTSKNLKIYQVDKDGNKEMLTVLRDGKMIFTSTTLSTFILVKEAEPKSEEKETVFKADHFEVEAKTEEDLSGLLLRIDEVEDEGNFGFSDEYQVYGYDIRFVEIENNEQEVHKNGQFTVKIPVPELLKGKNVTIIHEKDNGEREIVQYQIVGDKYVFAVDSFSWFIVVEQPNKTEDNKPEQPNPADPSEKPVTPADEANKPQEKPAESDTKPTANNGQTIKMVPLKAAQTKQADTKTSPDTGIAIHKTNSLFAGLLGMIGLGFLARKKRKF